MEILGLSLNHAVTPLEVRESVAFAQSDAIGFLECVQEYVAAGEVMLLSTCNRTEIYIVHHSGPGDTLDEQLLEWLRTGRGFEPREKPRNYALFRDAEAVRHLFRVAGGLESQILGESQILSQVKEVQGWAREAGTLGRVLHRLWERALRVGKRVRTETALGEGALSAAYAALELARKIFGQLRDRRVLVLGAGEIGILALENLQGVELDGLILMNRTRERAESLASQFGGEVRDFEELPRVLEEVDLVISSTASPEPLVTYETMKRVRSARGGNRPLLVVDLAIPRDFEPRCGQLDEIFLKNLDDLHEIVAANATERENEIPRAEAIVEAEVETYLEWTGTLDLEPTIRKLRERYHEVRREELEAWRGTVDDETFHKLDRLTRRLINRLLHSPTENIRRHQGLRDPDFADIIHEVLTQEIPHRKERDEP